MESERVAVAFVKGPGVGRYREFTAGRNPAVGASHASRALG